MNSIPLKNIVDITFGASSRCYQNFKVRLENNIEKCCVEMEYHLFGLTLLLYQ